MIRIFGSDDKGVRSCVHVHGIFPYFFVLCDHAPAWGFEGFQSPETYLRVFREALDAEVKADRAVERVRRAAGVSGARALGHGDAGDVDDDGDDDDAGAVDPAAREEAAVARAVRDRSRSILAVEWVSAHPMYGFHRRRCCFIRVVCRDQGARLAAARLLRAGRVLGHAFQPYELHVGPVLQAMMDRGWAGMTFAAFRAVSRRTGGVPCLGARVGGAAAVPSPRGQAAAALARAAAAAAAPAAAALPPAAGTGGRATAGSGASIHDPSQPAPGSVVAAAADSGDSTAWHGAAAGAFAPGGRVGAVPLPPLGPPSSVRDLERETACEAEYDAFASDVVADFGPGVCSASARLSQTAASLSQAGAPAGSLGWTQGGGLQSVPSLRLLWEEEASRAAVMGVPAPALPPTPATTCRRRPPPPPAATTAGPPRWRLSCRRRSSTPGRARSSRPLQLAPLRAVLWRAVATEQATPSAGPGLRS